MLGRIQDECFNECLRWLATSFPNLVFPPVVIMSIFFNVFALLALGELTQRVVILPRILAWFGRPSKQSEA